MRLYVLGRVDLLDADGSEIRSVLAQPRRLALLAYLAVTSSNGASRRDKLLGLFWPELSQERARKALNKAVHFLRHTLGEGAIVSRTAEELLLDPAHVWCDATAFADAIGGERLSEALDLYRGHLLPSFYIEDSAGFEAWADAERGRLRRLGARAARSLAQRREHEGQFTTAIGLARRAVELEGEDERSVRQLLALLDRLGDRAGALYAYDKFERQLAAEFGAEPAAETKALIEQVRARGRPAPTELRVVAPAIPVPEYALPSTQSVADPFRAHGYEIERELGRGGMAMVYLARDLKHDRQVALKVLSPEVNALRLSDRFAAEIRVTARLNHPNILPLFDSGSVEGLLYYTMPYVEGESLRARLEREKQLPVDEALKLITALSDALEHAHRCGVVHRDIKPENVLLQDGRPLLADFGIALALSSAGVERITSTGLSVGSPQYMSPEQGAGALSVGPHSDIYSLAAVAYELLVGEPPFTGPNTQAVLARVMLEPPRGIRTVRSAVPEPVEAAILKALAKHPADRFANAGEFGSALQVRQSALPSRVFQSRAALVALGTVVLAVGVMLTLAFLRQPVYAKNRVVVTQLENQTGDPAVDDFARELLTTLPDAIAREGIGNPVPATSIRDLLVRARGSSSRVAQWMARETGAGLQLRGTCFRSSGGTTCQVDLLRMPAKLLRMSVSVTGDPKRPGFGAELTERLLAALFLQLTWGDRVTWLGEYIPRSLAAVRAFRQAWLREEWQYLGEAARLDTGWVEALAWTADDSSKAAGDSLLARLARRPGLLEGERQAIAFRIAARRRDAEQAYELAMQRFRANPEWWIIRAAYWAEATNHSAVAVAVSSYADSLVDADKRRIIQSKTIRGFAFHHLGRYQDQLELAHEFERLFPNDVLYYRTHELMARAARGEVDSLRARLAQWQATPEPTGQGNEVSSGWAGSRAYIAGVELLTHGREDEGRTILGGLLPLYRRLRKAGESHPELIEILLLMGKIDEARTTALADLRAAKSWADSIGARAALGSVAAREGRVDQAARFDSMLALAGTHENTARDVVWMRAELAGWEGDRENAVRFLEQANAWGLGEHRFVHRDPAFASLRDYPPFQALLRPRD